MLDISSIATVVATASVVVGVIFTVLELRHMTRTRQTDLIMRIFENVSSKEATELLFRVGGSKFTSFDDYTKKYGLTDAAEAIGIFERVGLLLEQNLIDIRLVDRLFGGMIATMWEKLEPVVHGMRKRLGQPYLAMHFEYLYYRMQAYGASDQRKKHYSYWKEYEKKYGLPLPSPRPDTISS